MSTLFPHRFKPASSATRRTLPSNPAPEQIRSHGSSHTAASSQPKTSHPASNLPFTANYASSNLTLGAGVAIFHIATGRVVLCYHSKEHHYFLPKGRKDVNEEATRGAEREGYEESGYRNRVIPIPIPHRQPRSYHPDLQDEDGCEHGDEERRRVEDFVVEPVWMQLLPLRRSQYVLFWYVAETVPPEMEGALSKREEERSGAYQAPERWGRGLTVRQRVEMEGKGYEPVRHENTGVDEDEKLYVSSLVSVEEAIWKLGPKNISADVVRRGWEAVELRRLIEEN